MAGTASDSLSDPTDASRRQGKIEWIHGRGQCDGRGHRGAIRPGGQVVSGDRGFIRLLMGDF